MGKCMKIPWKVAPEQLWTGNQTIHGLRFDDHEQIRWTLLAPLHANTNMKTDFESNGHHVDIHIISQQWGLDAISSFAHRGWLGKLTYGSSGNSRRIWWHMCQCMIQGGTLTMAFFRYKLHGWTSGFSCSGEQVQQTHSGGLGTTTTSQAKWPLWPDYHPPKIGSLASSINLSGS